jgi:hypothetical protein
MTNRIYDNRKLEHRPPTTWLEKLIQRVRAYFKDLFDRVVTRHHANTVSTENRSPSLIIPIKAKNGEGSRLKKDLGSVMPNSIPLPKNEQRPANDHLPNVNTSKNYRQKPTNGILRPRHRGKIR